MMTYVSELRYDDAVNSTNILHNISLSCNILNKAKVIIHNLYALVVFGISALTLEFDLSGLSLVCQSLPLGLMPSTLACTTDSNGHNFTLGKPGIVGGTIIKK